MNESCDCVVKTTQVEAVVTAVIEEFNFVHLETAEGDLLGIGKRTRGIRWRDLRIGQRILCELETGPLPRVVSAQVVEPPESYR